MAVIVIFLAGALIWGTFGHIDSSVRAAVIADGEKEVCLLPENALESAVKDRKVKIDNKEYGPAPFLHIFN